jgi:quinol monooxygenase YgiN
MFGQINKITAAAGKREELLRLVISGSDKMPGCRSFVVAKDAEDADVIWVTEVWDSPDLHKASMDIPDVKASVEQAMPMIARFETVATTIPEVSP